MNLAVRGHLVPRHSEDEPPQLAVNEEKPAVSSDDKQPNERRTARNTETQGWGGELPSGWTLASIESLLGEDSQNGYAKKPNDAVDGIPILRISAGTMRADGIVAEEEHKLIGGVSAKERKQFELRPGDLLACRFNGNRNFVGRFSLYVGYLGIEIIYPDKLIRLRLNRSLAVPELVRHFAGSDVVRADIESYCATTVGNWGYQRHEP